MWLMYSSVALFSLSASRQFLILFQCRLLFNFSLGHVHVEQISGALALLRVCAQLAMLGALDWFHALALTFGSLLAPLLQL